MTGVSRITQHKRIVLYALKLAVNPTSWAEARDTIATFHREVGKLRGTYANSARMRHLRQAQYEWSWELVEAMDAVSEHYSDRVMQLAKVYVYTAMDNIDICQTEDEVVSLIKAVVDKINAMLPARALDPSVKRIGADMAKLVSPAALVAEPDQDDKMD